MSNIDEREQARFLLDRRLAHPLIDALEIEQSKGGHDGRCLRCGTRAGPFFPPKEAVPRKSTAVLCRVCKFFSISFNTLKEGEKPKRGRLSGIRFLVYENRGATLQVSESYRSLRAAAQRCSIAVELPGRAECVARAIHSEEPYVYGGLGKSIRDLSGHWHLGTSDWFAVSGVGAGIPAGRYPKARIRELSDRWAGFPPAIVEIARALIARGIFADRAEPLVARRLLSGQIGKKAPLNDLPHGSYAMDLLDALDERYPGLCAAAREVADKATITLVRWLSQSEVAA